MSYLFLIQVRLDGGYKSLREIERDDIPSDDSWFDLLVAAGVMEDAVKIRGDETRRDETVSSVLRSARLGERYYAFFEHGLKTGAALAIPVMFSATSEGTDSTVESELLRVIPVLLPHEWSNHRHLRA